MIRSIIKISDISVIDQNVNDNIYSFSRINYNEVELGSGSFGSVHKVLSIDGLNIEGFVIKIINNELSADEHTYETIKVLHDKLKRNKSSSLPIYHHLPEFLGLPFAVFKGFDEISNQSFTASLMFDLDYFKFRDFDVNPESVNTLPVLDKFYITYQFAKGYSRLRGLLFLHSDISDDSIWVNPSRSQLSIIDYDGGYHYDSQEKPITLGKLLHATSGFFKKLLKKTEDSVEVNTADRQNEENWKLANFIFELIFGTTPYFFLIDAEESTKVAYLKNFKWPEIELDSPFFNKSNTIPYNQIISFIKQLEEVGALDLLNAFKSIFNEGNTKVHRRLNPEDWKDLLFELNKQIESEPSILDFSSDKKTISKKGEEVEFKFKATKFNAIYVNDSLVPLFADSYKLPLVDSTTVILKVVNDFGTVESSIDIMANKKTPIIKEFDASKLLRDSLDPITISWKVENAEEVRIVGYDETFESSGELEVEPIGKTKYTIQALGFFDEIIEHELTLDIKVPVIKSFIWEVNLNEGIDNIDLHWETENAVSVEITPNVKIVETSGTVHVPIQNETKFKLVAKGLFSEVEKEIIAFPFPVPIVKQIFAETPKIEVNTKVDFAKVSIPKELFESSSIKFTSDLNMDNLKLNDLKFNTNLNIPEFKNENLLIKKYSKKKLTLSHIYQEVLEKIHKKLS